MKTKYNKKTQIIRNQKEANVQIIITVNTCNKCQLHKTSYWTSFLREMQRIAFRLMLSSCVSVSVCLCVCMCVCVVINESPCGDRLCHNDVIMMM